MLPLSKKWGWTYHLRTSTLSSRESKRGWGMALQYVVRPQR